MKWINDRLQKRNSDGFTVIELLIVIVVVVILSVLIFTTYGGIQEKNRNITRNNDLEAIHNALEKYYSKDGHYPSRGDMNSAKWVASNLPSLDPSYLIDPSNPGKSETLTATPTQKFYAYEPTQIDGVSSCEQTDTTCSKYTLIAEYEGSVNGATKLIIPSTN